MFDCNDFHNQNSSKDSIQFENYNNIRFNARVRDLRDKYYACQNPRIMKSNNYTSEPELRQNQEMDAEEMVRNSR